MSTPESESDPFLDAISRLGPALLQGLDALEQAFRRLDPAAVPALRGVVGPLRDRVEEALEEFAAVEPPEPAAGLAEQLAAAGRHAVEALRLFSEPGGPEQAVARLLGAMSEHCRIQERIYPLRRALPPFGRWFLEPALRERDTAFLDPESPALDRVGILHASNEMSARGGFSLYVPESLEPGERRPLIVALHGGSGHGRDFLWSWLREARSRRCLLIAPTARGSTWSFMGADVDAPALRSMVAFVGERWPFDEERVLLTGLSDGATYTLFAGLQADMPFSHLAPLSGVLHPANFANGNLARAAGRPVYLVHGARDWMFPVAVAQGANEELAKAGAEVVYREIEDLSHTYAREENARILDWMGVGLDQET